MANDPQNRPARNDGQKGARRLDPRNDMVELTRYPNRAEADMFVPLLEDAEIDVEVEDVLESGEPTGTVRILVRPRRLDEAQRLYEEYESERPGWRASDYLEDQPPGHEDEV